MLEKSTAASLFWNIDQMKEIASELSNAGTRLLLNLQRQVDDPRTVTLAGPGIMDAPGVAICGA
jgi:hypothetical protein